MHRQRDNAVDQVGQRRDRLGGHRAVAEFDGREGQRITGNHARLELTASVSEFRCSKAHIYPLLSTFSGAGCRISAR